MRARSLIVASAATLAILAVSATSAFATPTKTTQCGACHSGPALTVSASQTSNNGTNATYSLSAPGANSLAVFDGTTKIATILASTGQFSAPINKTYVIHAVKGPSTSSGYGSTSVSPIAPPPPPPPAPDTTAPVTASNAKASYYNTATITLTAVDNAGGSGVAATYYRLDSAPTPTAGTVAVTSVVGTHTLEFWSVDASGNAEAPKTVSFTVTKQLPLATVTTPVCASTVYRNRAFTTYGYLKPRHTAGTYGVKLYFYRYESGVWKLRKTVPAKLSNYSTYSKYTASTYVPYAGKWRVRGYHAADAQHRASYSSYRYFTAK